MLDASRSLLTWEAEMWSTTCAQVVYLRVADMVKRCMGETVPLRDRITMQSASMEVNRVLCLLASRAAGFHIEEIMQARPPLESSQRSTPLPEQPRRSTMYVVNIDRHASDCSVHEFHLGVCFGTIRSIKPTSCSGSSRPNMQVHGVHD